MMNAWETCAHPTAPLEPGSAANPCTACQHASVFPFSQAGQGTGHCVLLGGCSFARGNTHGPEDEGRGEFSHGASSLGALHYPKGQGILSMVSLVRALTVCVYPGTSQACSASSGVWEIAMLWFAFRRVSIFPIPLQRG